MAVQISSFQQIEPKIYAYTTPGVSYHDGWTKVGYTEKQSVTQRIRQQTHTANIHWNLAWQDFARFKDSGEYFTDHDFHSYLEAKQIPREAGTEWFQADGERLQQYFNAFANRKLMRADQHTDYTLRAEQQEAVRMTKTYFEQGGTEFLWNAKPRFGKTLSSYDLIRQMGFTKVLIVTNRPSIANSWADDFHKFIGWREELAFVSETDALTGKLGVMSRAEYSKLLDTIDDDRLPGMVAFESLQGLKGSVYFGGEYTKLDWMAKEYTDGDGKKKHGVEFDLLIVDEAQEGIDTMRTERAFQNISRKHTLYLSGTPFKALASEQFAKEQIFNWSYADEQEAKAGWDKDAYNPYEQLPRLAMYTYQLSNMICEQVQQGLDLSDEDETVDYAFDLNEFFAVNETGAFLHKAEIVKFLHALSTNEKYPYSTPELRAELPHTLWLLNRVASAKALKRLLEADPVFAEYEIIMAAGDGRDDDESAAGKAFDRVKEAIATHEKTITLSVGQLTVGVTIPEWSGVLMLCNLQSPSSYMQAAFRAQNPCTMTKEGHRFRKEMAYVFDFDPARTLIIFDEFANNLSPDTAGSRGTGDERKENIRRLLNFFPVLGEDEQGRMVELDAAQVLSIPRRLKSQEVVRHGFVSNFLFQNIGTVFGAPAVVQEIVGKLTPAHEDPKKRDKEDLSHIADVSVDEHGEVDIPQKIVIGKSQKIFGDKLYERLTDEIVPKAAQVAESVNGADMKQSVQKLADAVKEGIKQQVVAPVVDAYDVKKTVQNRLEKQVEQEIDQRFNQLHGDYQQKAKVARAELERKQQESVTEADKQAAAKAYTASMNEAMQTFTEEAQSAVQEIVQAKPTELVEQVERQKAEDNKKSVEDSIRAHLRGFSRTIPSFIMAYGDGHLTLQDFDDYTEVDVFEEVTGITEDEFRFLRDGGDYTDPETGETKHFAGHLFDETVFNDAIEEFWNKKLELADYFNEAQTEDIFDYIPPQKTNQIFTPRWVVKKMVDELEQNNPGCFDDPTKTFADLYMKSGLYITEIVKRLFRSEKMKEQFPDDGARLRHILSHQVYGMAPTRIIYLIATNYILGFDETLKAETMNFVQADAAEAAKEGRLAELVTKHFG